MSLLSIKGINVYSDTYANLPVVGLRAEDLGYATDRLVLYRWSGAAWVAITIHSSAGLATNIPTAADLPNGSIYHETDTDIVRMVESGGWVIIAQGTTLLFRDLTVALFQVNPATGTFTVGVSYINDTNVATVAGAAGVGQYAEVQFNDIYNIRNWRQYGDVTNVGDGSWKIQYWDLATRTWVDWVTGIATRTTADWSAPSTETVVYTSAIRLVCTGVDSQISDFSDICQLEVYY